MVYSCLMMMNKPCYFLLFFEAMFIALATSQPQACVSSQEALAANAKCTAANSKVQTYLQRLDGVDVSREDLNMYCSETCRDLNRQIIADCTMDEDEPDVQVQRRMSMINLLCSINEDKNCIEFIISNEVLAFNSALISNQCPFLGNEVTCPDNCSLLVENFITAGECCTLQLLEFENNHDEFNVTYDQLVSYCELNPPQFTPCEVININDTRSGAGWLKTFAYVVILMITLIAITLF